MNYDLKKYPLKPEVVAFLDKVAASYPAHRDASSVEDGRHAYAVMCTHFDVPIPDNINITDDVIAGRATSIPVRIYETKDGSADVLVIYYHGGGFVLGNLDTHNTICADMAHATGYKVVAVDYRLTPDHPYPAHFHDALDAFVALDRGRTIVCGDSAGGTLAAAVCVDRHKSHKRPIAQVLIYPFLGGEVLALDSYEEAFDAPLLTKADVDYFEKLRSAGQPPVDDPNYFPLAQADFSDFPPCSAFAAQFDPIRDDAVEYVKRLQSAGVDAHCTIEPGLVHGYLRGRHECADMADSFKRICAAIRKYGEMN